MSEPVGGGVGNTPVYIIGGHFGSGGGPGWLLSIGLSLLAVIGGFVGALVLETYKRRRDNLAITAAFASEVTAVTNLFIELDMVQRMADLHNLLETLRQTGAEFQPFNDDPFAFPTSVYDKNLDKLGGMGVHLASEVVWFYNFIYGFRVGTRIAIGTNTTLIEGRRAAAEYVLVLLKRNLPRAIKLRDQLTIAATRSTYPSMSAFRVRIVAWIDGAKPSPGPV